jgi:N-acetylglucosamine kinase-like BadF-type ATPase
MRLVFLFVTVSIIAALAGVTQEQYAIATLIVTAAISGAALAHVLIKSIRREIMNALETLQNAVTDQSVAVAEGFEAIGSALTELASDVANLPANADVETEAARLSQNTETIRNLTAQFAQQVRDAIPTAPVDPPVDPIDPPVDPEA